MSKSVQVLANREQGQFALSIGTSLALESLDNLVPDRPVVRPAPISRIDAVLVNVRTLHRNMMASLKAVDKDVVTAQTAADFLREEMQQVRTAMQRLGNGKVEAYFYLCRYPDLKREFPHAHLIGPQTKKQMRDRDLEKATMDLIIANPGRYGAPKLFDYYVEGGGLKNDRVAMLTHIPLDLTRRHDFRELFLLESNTGVLKAHQDWSSKFKVKPEGAFFPFNAFTLQIFGDGGKLFAPMESEVIEYVTGLSKQYKWTYMTTKDKISHGIASSGSKFTSFLRTLLRD